MALKPSEYVGRGMLLHIYFHFGFKPAYWDFQQRQPEVVIGYTSEGFSFAVCDHCGQRYKYNSRSAMYRHFSIHSGKQWWEVQVDFNNPPGFEEWRSKLRRDESGVVSHG